MRTLEIVRRFGDSWHLFIEGTEKQIAIEALYLPFEQILDRERGLRKQEGLVWCN